MNKTKRNVAIGALTGVLVGFVFGVVFIKPDSSSITTDARNTKGNVMNISRFEKPGVPEEENPEAAQTSDTLSFAAVDENGKDVQILIIK
jgi:hypothetical protein